MCLGKGSHLSVSQNPKHFPEKDKEYSLKAMTPPYFILGFQSMFSIHCVSAYVHREPSSV